MKLAKKIMVLFVALVMSMLLVVPALAEETSVSVSLRIEGAEKNLFYGTVDIPYADGLTVLDAVKFADAESEDLTVTVVTSQYGDYISGINGENEAQILFDGWLFNVNGISPSVGVSAHEIKNGDIIVLYYCDAYGTEGFQTPILDDSKIDEGVLRFTSKDVTYDAEYNPVETVNPVVGATVTWGYDDKTAEYITDENGEIKIASAQLTRGEHSVQIEKYSVTTTTTGGKLPLALRLPADTVVTVENAPVNDNGGETDDTDSSKEELNDNVDEENVSDNETENKSDVETSDNPKTGESAYIYFLVILSFAAISVIVANKKVITK